MRGPVAFVLFGIIAHGSKITLIYQAGNEYELMSGAGPGYGIAYSSFFFQIVVLALLLVAHSKGKDTAGGGYLQRPSTRDTRLEYNEALMDQQL